MSNLAKREDTSSGIVREGFSGSEIERRNETSSTAIAAQARAEIEAQYVMAMERPRNPDAVRLRLLTDCRRPGFAARAFFSLPKGDKPGRITGIRNRIEGLSVRYAEAAIRHSGNIRQQTKTTYDDDFKRQLTVSAIDLETNAVYSRDLIIEKTVERKTPKDKAVILGKRTNSAGDEVYIVQATEDELLQKESALVSRAFRTLALRLVPADVLEECEQAIVTTIRDEHAKDPDAARKAIVESFSKLGVPPEQLAEYLGHDLGGCAPGEMLDLRGLYGAIRDGEVTWAEAHAERLRARDGVIVEQSDGAKASSAKSVAERIASRTARKAQEKQQAEAKPSAAPHEKSDREPGEDG